MSIDAQIESILFYRAEAMTIAELATLIQCTEEEIRAGIDTLVEKLSGRGICLVRYDNAVELATSSEAVALIERMQNGEWSRDLSKAALETLAIVLYRGPATRMEIDYIRGVNSQTILRSLAVRGLIEKRERGGEGQTASSDGSGRSALYVPSLDLLAHLGVSRIDDLPRYREFKEEIGSFEKTNVGSAA